MLIDRIENHSLAGIPGWLRLARPDILAWLIEQTEAYCPSSNTERIYIVLHGEPPKCSDGNYRKFDAYTTGYRTGCKLSHRCADVIKDRREKQRQGWLEKYGVENVMALPEFQERTKQTNLAKYGVEHHSQNDEIKTKTIASHKARSVEERQASLEKTRETNRKKFGTDHHMKNATQQDKVKTTNIERYGAPFPLQNSDCLSKMKETCKSQDRDTIQSKARDTMMSRYGVSAPSRMHISPEVLAVLDDRDRLLEAIDGKTLDTIADELGLSTFTIVKYAKKYKINDTIKSPSNSAFELGVAALLDSMNVKYVMNTRNIIAPKELDFYLPDHNLAIECGGLYWHSELSAGRTKFYHRDKYLACKTLGIDLLTIFSDEWDHHQTIVENIIRNKIQPTSRLMARSCKVVECTLSEAKEFINSYHIQQYSPSTVRIGLQHDGELVAIMTFAKSRFSGKKNANGAATWEIVRYCASHNVTGGAQRLLSHFKKMYSSVNIVSYSDNRWFTGKMYETLGFTPVADTIGYSYTNYKHRFNRMNFQKHKLVSEGYDPSLTEWEIMQSRKFDRIWDCGQIRWELLAGDK